MPSIEYVQLGASAARYRLLGNGDVVHYDKTRHKKPDYLLSDEVDIGYEGSHKFTLLISSENEKSCKEFSKRVREAGYNGIKITLPPFTTSELLIIKPLGMSDEEAMFRADVFGGRARSLIATAVIIGAYLWPVVERTMKTFFTEEYKDLYSHSWDNIVSSISYDLSMMRVVSYAACHTHMLNNLFFHVTSTCKIIWASIFMKCLATALLRKDYEHIYIPTNIKTTFQLCAFENMFESFVI